MQADTAAIADRVADQWLSQYSPEEIELFLSGDKDLTKWREDPVGFCESHFRETYTDDIERMMESVRDNRVTIARSGNGPGKTFAAARVALWFYKAFYPNAKVFTAAAPPVSNLEDLLWGEISSAVRKNPALFKHDYFSHLRISNTPPLGQAMKDNIFGDEDDDGAAMIRGLTIPTSGTSEVRQAKFSGKHAPYMLFIFDEGDAIPDEVYLGAESCMSGGHVRMLIMFNPRSKLGVPYQKERDSLANVVEMSAMSHPNVVTGKDIVPGAVTCEQTVLRINKWCRPLAEGEPVDENCFELPAYLEDVAARREDGRGWYEPLTPGWYRVRQECPWFWYMVKGEYPPSAPDQLIPEDAITKARSRWDAYVAVYGEKPPEGTSAIMGQDVAEFGVDKNVSCFRYGGWVDRFLEWANVNTTETAEKAAKEYKSRRVSICHVDATGVGSGVAPLMIRHGCLAAAVKVASRPTRTTELGDFHILRDQLWWQVREWLVNDPWSMIPPDEELIQELMVPTYTIKNGRVCIMPKDDMKEHLGRSPNKADALCLTFADGVVSQPRAAVDPGTREKHKQKARVLGV